jgi:hypothetical protein
VLDCTRRRSTETAPPSPRAESESNPSP